MKHPSKKTLFLHMTKRAAMLTLAAILAFEMPAIHVYATTDGDSADVVEAADGDEIDDEVLLEYIEKTLADQEAEDTESEDEDEVYDYDDVTILDEYGMSGIFAPSEEEITYTTEGAEDEEKNDGENEGETEGEEEEEDPEEEPTIEIVHYGDYSSKYSSLTTDKFFTISTKMDADCYTHVVRNLVINDYVRAAYEDGFEAYEYNGTVYYFKKAIPGSTDDPYYTFYVSESVTPNRTSSVVLLTRIVYNGDTVSGSTYVQDTSSGLNDAYAYLYDATAWAALQKAGSSTSPYIAPNGDLLEAFVAYLAERYTNTKYHIDNWIIGNEVNCVNEYFYTGSTNATYNGKLMASLFARVYEVVKKHGSGCRVSISLDNSWTYTGSTSKPRIGVKSYLSAFVSALKSAGKSSYDWCVSYHCYPPYTNYTSIWTTSLCAKSTSAKFVSGYNLEVITNYVRDNYGSNHRFMLTECGFAVDSYGVDKAHAALAITMNAVKYNGMVDCFVLWNINETSSGGNNYHISSTKDSSGYTGSNIYDWICYGTNTSKINTFVKKISGSNLSSMVYNYGYAATTTKVQKFVKALYTNFLGRSPSTTELYTWTYKIMSKAVTPINAVYTFATCSECKKRGLSNKEMVKAMSICLEGKQDSELQYYAQALGYGCSYKAIINGLASTSACTSLMSSYGLEVGSKYTLTATIDKNMYVTMFVARLYTKCLGRSYDKEGLEYWTGQIITGKKTVKEVANGFFRSSEFKNKNLSSTEFVKVLYRTYMNREYDAEGLAYWVKQLNGTLSRDGVRERFYSSPEFQTLMAAYGL